jgi:U6 snRNA-associated Sm-like protein LSm6
MNIALEQTEEHVNGKVTNKYGDAFIRGNNGEQLCAYESCNLVTDSLIICAVLYISAAEAI